MRPSCQPSLTVELSCLVFIAIILLYWEFSNSVIDLHVASRWTLKVVETDICRLAHRLYGNGLGAIDIFCRGYASD